MKWYSASLHMSVVAFLPHLLSEMQQNSGKAYVTYTQRITFHYLREWDIRRSQTEMPSVLFQEHSLTNVLVAFLMSDMGSTSMKHITHDIAVTTTVPEKKLSHWFYKNIG